MILFEIIDYATPGWVKTINKLPKLLGDIMTKLSELSTQLVAVRDQLAKAANEIVTKIGELQAALADVALTPEAEDALAALAVQAKALDDIIPDVPVEEPVV
jgi:DNA repair exonuclease SbcCD ATPase subunit